MRGARLEEEWRGRREAYEAAHPGAAEEFRTAVAGELPSGWDADIPDLSAPPKPLATRVFSGQVLQGLGRRIPNLFGGSADLAGSNKTTLAGADNLLPDTPGGRVIHFGVREHAMGGILNGMALHRGVRPYGGTFLIFSDYMRPSIRLAALMNLPVTYVFTHDSIGVGEDGPTHQPIEQLCSLRAIPGVLDLRPADGPETAEAWRAALAYTRGPSFLALTRQAVAIIDRDVAAPATGLHRGGYILLEADGDPEVVLIASGSEVGVVTHARTALQARRRVHPGGIHAQLVPLLPPIAELPRPGASPRGHGAHVRGSRNHGGLDPLAPATAALPPASTTSAHRPRARCSSRSSVSRPRRSWQRARALARVLAPVRG